MIKLFFPSALFLSYIPLWITISFIDFREILSKESLCLWTEKISLLSIFAGFIIAICIFVKQTKYAKSSKKKKYIIKSAEEDKTLTTEYILSSILPLLAFDFTKWYEVVQFLIFYIFLFLLNYHHEDLHLAVIFDLLHLHTYRCELKSTNMSSEEFGIEGKTIIKTVVSKKNMNFKCGSEFAFFELGDEYLMEIKEIDLADR